MYILSCKIQDLLLGLLTDLGKLLTRNVNSLVPANLYELSITTCSDIRQVDLEHFEVNEGLLKKSALLSLTGEIECGEEG